MAEEKSKSGERVPLSTRREFDAICDRFEKAWSDGISPVIEEVLEEVLTDERPALLSKLLQLELELRRKAGHYCQREDYQRRFADYAVVVKEAFRKHHAKVVASTTDEMQIATSAQHPDLVVTEKNRNERAAADEGLPEHLGRYLVVDVLGRGGFGTVYLGHDELLDRQVAIKVPRTTRFSSAEEVDEFTQEARTAAKLDHQGIVRVYDADRTDNGSCYVVMEYVAGQSLDEVLRVNPRPDPQRVAELITRVAEAVHHAHQQGFVHRDLKPANILIDNSGRPKVADFGLALHEEMQAGTAGEVSGTPAYMAPEQVRGEAHRLDGRTDIWAIGAILYEMLTGRRPFCGKTTPELFDEIEHREPKPPRQIDDAIPYGLECIALKCLSKNVVNRYSTAADLARDLRRCWESAESDLHAAVDQNSARVKNRRLTASLSPAGLVGAGFGLLVLLVIVASSFIPMGSDSHANPGRDSSSIEQVDENGPPPASPEIEAVDMSARQEDASDVGIIGLKFNGMDSFVELPGVSHNGREPLTIEALIYTKGFQPGRCIVGTEDANGLGLGIDHLGRWYFGFATPNPDESNQNLLPIVSSEAFVEQHRLTHVAGVFDGWKLRLYVDGLLQSNHKSYRPLKPLRRSWFCLGGRLGQDHKLTSPFGGVIDAVRFSEGVRYNADFQPPFTLQRESDTLALFMLESGDGQIAFDLANRPVDGRIQNAEWVKLETLTHLPKCSDELAFSGDREVTAKLETSHGLMTRDFALCQSATLPQFEMLVSELKALGYRPICCRPFSARDEIQVAAVWTRDDRAWEMILAQSRDEILSKDEDMRARHYSPIDVSVYSSPRAELRFAAIWNEAIGAEKTWIDVHLQGDQHEQDLDLIFENGARFINRDEMVDPKTGKVLRALVWKQLGVDYWNRGHWGPRQSFEYNMHRNQGSIVSCSLSLDDQEKFCFAGIWFDPNPLMQGTTVESHGLRLDVQQQWCRRQASRGLRPVCLDVAYRGSSNEYQTISVWQSDR